MTPSKPLLLFCHLLAILALGIGVGAWTLQEPALGDDLGYWRLAISPHGPDGNRWDLGFHSLRWPVWGLSWLLQFVVGQGPASYYGVPLVYLGLGGVLAFLIARMAFGTVAAGWCAALLLIFHPILDPSITRPMPDLSEGVLSAAAVLAWLLTMRSESASGRWLFSALTGLAIAMGYANRITGSFVVVALVLGTLLLYRKRFRWLLLAGVFTICFMALEGLVYFAITGDFLHSIHANLGARGRKGTEAVELWELPLRFLDSLWDENLLKRLLILFSLAGSAISIVRGAAIQRAIVLWGAAIYFCYSCGLQSLDPLRPMVRDGDRFISALAFPLAILAAGFLVFLVRQLSRLRLPEWAELFLRPNAGVGAVLTGLAVCSLMALSSRPAFDPGFLRPMRAFLLSVPDGASVTSHEGMRDLAFFAEPSSLERLKWRIPRSLIHDHPETTASLAESDFAFYNRKSIWTGTRKDLEREAIQAQRPLGPLFADPVSDWRAVAVLAKDHTPDLTFLRRRKTGDPAPEPLSSKSLLGVEMPSRWEGLKRATYTLPEIPIPNAWRGRVVRLQVIAAANTVEAVSMRLSFSEGTRYVLKPYLYPQPGKEVLNFTIPPGATSLEIRVSISKWTKWVLLEDLSVTLDGPAEVHARSESSSKAAD